jgi:fumarate reductase iron-sulfur subunit
MAENEKTIEIEVLRYDPDKDEQPHFQTFTVPYIEHWVVLDALNHIKDEIDQSLTFRWSCHMAVCGSCGFNINGEPHLGCKTFIRDFYPNKVRVEPIANFPIERDLVVVQDDFIEKFGDVKPYIIRERHNTVEEGTYEQSRAELIKFKQYTMCINCLLCYSACPQYGLNPEFYGPAALSMGHRYNADSRDEGREERMEVLAEEEGVWGCTFVGACSRACPKDVDPAGAIQQMKITATNDWMKEKLMPWGKK